LAFAVQLYFDRKTEQTVIELWNKLKVISPDNYMPSSGNYPHITTAIFSEVNINALIQITDKYTKTISIFEMDLCSFGNFIGTDVVYLAPVVTKNLLHVHMQYHKKIRRLKNQFEYYMPGNWIPHCTISLNSGISSVPEIISFLVTNFTKMKCTVERIGIIEFRPVKILWEKKIKSG